MDGPISSVWARGIRSSRRSNPRIPAGEARKGHCDVAATVSDMLEGPYLAGETLRFSWPGLERHLDRWQITPRGALQGS